MTRIYIDCGIHDQVPRRAPRLERHRALRRALARRQDLHRRSGPVDHGSRHRGEVQHQALARGLRVRFVSGAFFVWRAAVLISAPLYLGISTTCKLCCIPPLRRGAECSFANRSCPSPPVGVVSTKQQREKYRQRLLTAFEPHYHPDHSVPRFVFPLSC